MGKYIVIIKPTAEKDLKKHKKSGNKSVKRKIIKILKELETQPYEGIGNPERLRF